MKTLVCTISGFSASSRKAKKTLSAFVEKALAGNKVECFHQFSTADDCVENLIRKVMTTKCTRVILVGKSMGGVEVWWALTKYWHHLKFWLSHPEKKIGVVLIDPHGCKRGDGRIGSYGRKLLSLRTLRAWANRDDFRIHGLYQRDKYPRGAKISNGSNVTCEKLENASHWDVTMIDTDAGQKCADSLISVMGWVNEN